LRRGYGRSKCILFWRISDSSLIFGNNPTWVEDILSEWLIAQEVMSVVELAFF
jgi:hypothetical protein